MPKLTTQKCQPCEGGVKPLTSLHYAPLLKEVSKWKVINGKQIEREFQFKDFKTALAFVNDVGKIAEKEGHHPDFSVHYNIVDFEIWTHAVNGLTENDFILAAKIDLLV